MTTVEDHEVSKHAKLADVWWDENGEMKPLHSMNKLRVQLVRDGLFVTKMADSSLLNKPKPLTNMKILDVGCGGGILSEPLARIGADVTGIDPGTEVISVARSHALKDSSLAGKIHYFCESIEDHAVENKEKYDAVVASEVIEHVTAKEQFLESCSNVLKVIIFNFFSHSKG